MSITLPQNYRPTEREPFMNAMQQEYFRQKLLKWKNELIEESKNEDRELHVQAELFALRDGWYNGGSFAKLKERVSALSAQSKAADDSEDRRIARRVLSNFAASARSTRDPQYQELLDAIRRPAPGR